MDRSEIENRLCFNDVTIRCRCVLKIIETVVAKVPKGSRMTSTTEIPELTFLWEKCAECSNVASYVAESLVSLVSRNVLDFDYAANKFLSAIASAENAHVPVHSLMKLLYLQEEEKCGAANARSYSLQNPQHPLISALIRRSDSWRAIIESILKALWNNDERNLGIKLVEPVVKYILFQPPTSDVNSLMKDSLCGKLCQMISDDYSLSNLMDIIITAVPWLQVRNLEEVDKAVSYVLHMNRCVMSEERFCNTFPLANLLLSSLTLCHSCIKYGFDDAELLIAANNMIGCIPDLAEGNEPSLIINACCVIVSVMMTESTCSAPEMLIQMGKELLAKSAISPTVAGMVLVSVVEAMSEPKIISIVHSEIANNALLEFQRDLQYCHEKLGTTYDCETMEKFKHFEAFTAFTNKSLNCVFSALKWDLASNEEKIVWLKYIKDHVNGEGSISSLTFHLVCSFFMLVRDDDMELLQQNLDVLEAIAIKHPEMSPKLFSLLLYKQLIQKDPKSQVLILEYLIKTATHKYALLPVLGILQTIAKHPSLKAQAIYLMVQLWKKHSRCLSVVNELLCEKDMVVSLDTGVHEVLIAQAAAIKEICMERPEQHGGEFLSLLSTILNTATDEASCPAAVLALEGVHALCESEVIDIRSTWKVLAPRLCKDKRVLISTRMYELLSLVPKLCVKSYEYDKFMSDIALYLWKQISIETNPPETVGAIYKALAKFPTEYHTLKVLPTEAKEKVKLPASMACTPFEMGKLPEDVLTYTPGHCFIDLLQSIDNTDVLEGYTEFLTSLIQEEVKSLPRGIYHKIKSIGPKKIISDSLTPVPAILCQEFHSSRFPIIQKNLAVGLLLSYESPVIIGKDGRPVTQSVVEQDMFYLQVLEAMLSDVNLEISEWRRCILTPSAWGAFMERAFFACEEGRRAQIEVQRLRGHLRGTAEEISCMIDTAWLGVRDSFMELIKKTASKSSSCMGNAVFAVAGLVRALDKFYSCLEDKAKDASTACTNFKDHKTFQQECVESIICAMNPDYRPSSKIKIFGWLLTHHAKPSTNASYVVQSCACASLFSIVFCLSSADVSHASFLFEKLLWNLSANVSSVLALYSGIGLGLLIRALCQSGFVECGEQQVKAVLRTAEKVRLIFASGDDIKPCDAVCLTIVHSALSQNGNSAFFGFVTDVCDEFYNKLMIEDPSSVDFEVISICASCVIISTASVSPLGISHAIEVMEWFEKKRVDSPQCEGTAVSLGILVDALQKLGYAYSSDMRASLCKEWIKVSASEKRLTLHRLAALNGLCAMFSAGYGLIQISSELSQGNIQSGINDLVRLMCKFLQSPRDNGLLSVCSWQLGNLFSVHVGEQQDVSAVPSSYSYLNEASILKPLVNFVTESSEKGFTQYEKYLFVCVKALAQNFPRPLPPLNWISFISPLIQKTGDPEIREMYIEIAMYQMCGSSSAVSVLASYIMPPSFCYLSNPCHRMLLGNIPLLANFFPPAKLQEFFKSVVHPLSKKEKMFETEGIIALKAIMETLQLRKCNKAAVGSLHQAVLCTVNNLKANFLLLKKHVHLVCNSLLNLPAQLLDSAISVEDGLENLPSVIILCCHLVKIGCKPLSSLSSLIRSAQQLSLCEQNKVFVSLFHCFAEAASEDSDLKKPQKCIAFLMEMVGFLKVAANSVSESEEKVISYLVDISLVTVVGCAGFEASFPFYDEESIKHKSLMSSLPGALSTLMSITEWNKSHQVMEWLLFLYHGKFIKKEDKYYIKSSICLIRNVEEFAKSSAWIEMAS